MYRICQRLAINTTTLPIFLLPKYNCIYVFELSQRLINCGHFEFQHRVVVAFSDVSEKHIASVSRLSESHSVDASFRSI